MKYISEFIEQGVNGSFLQALITAEIIHNVEALLLVLFFTLLIATKGFGILTPSKIQSKDASEFQKNIEYKSFIINNLLIPLILIPIVWIGNRYGFLLLDSETGFLKTFYEVLVLLVVHDTYFYWTHRIMHSKMLYGKVHYLHHVSVTPTVFSSMTFDFFDLIVNFSYLLAMLLVGYIVDYSFSFLSITIFILIYALLNYHGHTGYEFVPRNIRESYVGKWFVWPSYHDIHHEKNDGNYGLYFTFWDRVCGTVSKTWLNRNKEISDRKI